MNTIASQWITLINFRYMELPFGVIIIPQIEASYFLAAFAVASVRDCFGLLAEL